MRSMHLSRPSPALVIACIALFVALGGTGYAVVKLPRNSVGTKQLKKNAVTSPKVKNNTITGADVNELTLGQVPSAGNADALDGLDSTAFSASGHHHEGLMLVSTAPTNWELSDAAPDTTIDYVLSEAIVERSSGLTNEHVVLSPDLPHGVYGKRTALVGAEICYDATDAGVVVDIVSVNRYTYSTTSSALTVSNVVDVVDRNDETCRLYSFPTPPVLGEEDAVLLTFSLDFTAAAQFRIGRTTLILQGTGTPATAPS